MDSYQVYRHHRKGETYYIGVGTLDRPWQISNRQEDHKAWLIDEVQSGRRLDHIVEILYENLTKEEALQIELDLITKERPIFNRNFRLKSTHKLNEEQVQVALELREQGKTYKSISEELGVSVMSIHRLLNGKIKGYLNWM